MKQSGIFFVRGEHGLTRIAHTNDLRKRMSEWKAASPFPLHVIAAVTTPRSTTDLVQWLKKRGADCRPTDTSSVYCALKRALTHLQVNGEWFALDDSTLDSIPAERLPSVRRGGKEDTWLHLTVADSCRGGTAWVRQCPTCNAAAEYNKRNARDPHSWNSWMQPTPSPPTPEAPLVWQVIQYADDLCSHLTGTTRLEAMFDDVVEWLVIHGRNNVEVVAQFIAEYDKLKDIATKIFYKDCYMTLDAIWDHFSWMVLQGELTFLRLLETPWLLDDIKESRMVSMCDFAPCALYRIAPPVEYENVEYHYLQDRLWHKAQPAEFSGWDGVRLAAEAARCQK